MGTKGWGTLFRVFLFVGWYSALAFSNEARAVSESSDQLWQHLACGELLRPAAAWDEAYSDRSPPFRLGRSAVERARGAAAQASPPHQLPQVLEPGLTSLPRGAEVEFWPTRDDAGRLRWVLARVKHQGQWHWAAGPGASGASADGDNAAAPMLPVIHDPQDPRVRKALLADFLEMDSLYDRPLFSEGLWIDAATGRVLTAWAPSKERHAWRQRVEAHPAGFRFVQLPRPAERDGEMTVYRARVQSDGHLEWLTAAPTFQGPESVPPLPARGQQHLQEQQILRHAPDFEERMRRDVAIFAGETPAVFPQSKAIEEFTRRSSADPDHQLERVVDYLEERYKELCDAVQIGCEAHRQRFSWRGIKQSNLIFRIPGRLPLSRNRPIVLADHIDAAYSEDVFAREGRRVSAPGANDNATATAALLRAAEHFIKNPPLHDIWIVHFTGEEFPADSLGARHWLSEVVPAGKQLGGVILMDMIGHNPAAAGARPIVQLSPGRSAASTRMAQVIQSAAGASASGYDVQLRAPHSDRSYLYNTDGIVIDDAGYPVVLINEHLNRHEHISGPHYHSSTDTSANVDFAYLTTVAQAALEAAQRLANYEEDAEHLPALPQSLPLGALAVPIYSQSTVWTCGVTALRSVLVWHACRHGETPESVPDEAELARLWGATPELGLSAVGIARATASVTGYSRIILGAQWEDLMRATSRGQPVLINYQGWYFFPWEHEDRRPGKDWPEGHYSVVIAADEHYAYVVDPSLANMWGRPAYGYIPRAELEARWRDEDVIDGRLWRHHRTAVVVGHEESARAVQSGPRQAGPAQAGCADRSTMAALPLIPIP